MALLYILAASFLIALSQLCIRAKAGEGKDEVLMATRFLISALICFFFYPFAANNYHLDLPGLVLGISAGLLQGLLMWNSRRALMTGYSGFAIAFVNSACVVTPIAMTLVFGAPFHFEYSWFKAIGALCVCLGFYVSAKELARVRLLATGQSTLRLGIDARIVRTLLIAFLFQVLFQLFLQWKSMNFRSNLPASPLLPLRGISAESLWFTPLMFSTCALFQLFTTKNRNFAALTRKDWAIFGGVGGLINGFSGVLLLIGIDKAASVLENVLLYPLLAVGTVCFCQVWAKGIFKEPIPWRANALLLSGIALSSL